MNTTYVDITIFVIFLTSNLAVGLWCRKGSKTFQEYAVGDKRFSTATLIATLVATWISGGTLLIELEETYRKGLYHVMAAIIGGSTGLLLTGRVIAPRMGKFLQYVSVAEALGALYGKHAQAITAIGSVLMNTGYVAIQLKVIFRVLTTLFGYEGPEVTIVAAAIMILYATTGGVKAVTFTDVIQFLTFGTFLPILALIVWHQIADKSQVAHMLSTNSNFDLANVVGWTPEFANTLLLMAYFACPGLPPTLFQRMAMGRDISQIKQSITYAALICLLVNLCIVWLGVLLLVDQPHLAPEQLMQYLVDNYTYTGFKGFLGIGIVALAMSSADSALNTAAVLIANDIVMPFWSTEKAKKSANALAIARWATLGIGCGALVLALYVEGLLQILLMSASFYGPIAVVPMLLAVFGFETSRRVVLVAMSAGIATVVVCTIYLPDVNSFFPGILVNGIFMLAAHYWLGEKGGWGNNPVLSGPTNILQYSNFQEGLVTVQQFNWRVYLDSMLPKHVSMYSLFGFYIFTAGYTSFYLIPSEIAESYPILYKLVQCSIPLIGTCFVSFPIWPQSIQETRFLLIIWPLSIFYILFLLGGMLVVASEFAAPQMLIFMLNFVMAVLLTNGTSAVTMTIIGALSTIVIFKQYAGFIPLPANLNSFHFQIIYGLLASSSFFIALFKHQKKFRSLEEQATWLNTERNNICKDLIRAREHEKLFFTEITNDGQDVLQSITKKVENFKQKTVQLDTAEDVAIANQMMKEMHATLKETMNYLRSVVYRVKDHIRLNAQTVSLKHIIAKSISMARVACSPATPAILFRDASKLHEIQCDTARIQQLVLNAVLYSHTQNHHKSTILIDIQPTKLSYPLSSLGGYIKKVDALCITVTLEQQAPTPNTFYMGNVGDSCFLLPRNTEELGLVDNLRIINAHYGTAEIKDTAAGPVQTYIIPQRLREVRPKLMDISAIEAEHTAKALKEVRPEEAALLDRLHKETQVDAAIAQKAIRTIKKYHAASKRKSGEPFYLHPIAATDILLSYSKDPMAILSTLLHDTVKDTALTLSEIAIIFGPEVANIVHKVTYLAGELQRVKLNNYDNVKQLLEEQDERVLLVKLADRLHNMRTIDGHPTVAKRKQVALETQQFFVPIARQLGLTQIEAELQYLINEVMRSENVA